MDQLGEGRPDDAVARSPDLQAQVDVVERHLEVGGVEPPDPREHLGPQGEAGGRDRRDLVGDQHPGEVAASRVGHPEMEAVDDAPDAEDEAGVLDGAVRVEELGADGADIRAQGVPDHLAEPARLQHLDVVVQEQQDRAVAAAAPRFDRSEKLNGPGTGTTRNPGIARVPGEEGGGLRLAAVVVDDDQHLQRPVGGGGEEPVEGSPRGGRPGPGSGMTTDTAAGARGGGGPAG